MTDHDMIESSRAVALALETIADRHSLDRGDRVALAGMALTETLAQHLGPVGAVDHLRDLADTIERSILSMATKQ